MEAEETVKEGIDLVLPASLMIELREHLWNPSNAPMILFHGQATECGDQRKEFFGLETMLQRTWGFKRTVGCREQAWPSLCRYSRYLIVCCAALVFEKSK